MIVNYPARGIIYVEYETVERFKSLSEGNLSLSPVANLAFILGTIGEEEYHLRL